MTTDASIWPEPPEALTLETGEVHIWRAHLPSLQRRLRSLGDTLSPDEVQRAGRFRFHRDRERFICARGFLRVLLGRYLGVAPGRLAFRYNSFGKPFLSGDAGADQLCFNTSHSRGLVLYAVAWSRQVGVDTEYISPDAPLESIAAAYFAPGEVEQLQQVPEHLRRKAYYACWTRKEAYVKAVGGGLAIPLDQFEVSVTPGEPPTLVRVTCNPHEQTRWAMREFFPAPGYVGTVVAEGKKWQFKYWSTPDWG